MNIKNYSKILRLRNAAKRVQQLSWTISQMERKFNLDTITEKDYLDVIEAYEGLIPQVRLVLDELQAADGTK